jgi:anti-sigma regulatory factor (Ser/Thr protein kinase)
MTQAVATNRVGTAALSLSLPAQPVNVAVIRQAMTGVAESLEISAAVLADINMAVTEACTNVVLHAYPDGSGRFEVDVWPNGRQVDVIVSDDGSGFMPRPVQKDTSWRLGLPLIAALSDGLEVTSGPDGHGTVVRMTFDLR